MSTYYFMRYDVAYNGKVRQIVDGRKRVLASYRYDKDTGKITRYRDNAKNDINFKYDSRGNLIGISKRGAGEPDVLPVRSFEYIKGEMKPSRINELDSKGRVVRTTSIQYDASRRPVMISDGSREVKIGYNFYGYPIKFVDEFGLETSISYDRYNRRISRESGEVLERIEYDSNGFPVKVSAYGGGKELRSLEVCYGKDGYPETYKDSEGLSKRFERDGRGRVLKEIFPDLTEVKYGYDELGNLGKVVDQNGHEIKFEWGANGLDRRKTAVGQITENRYDEYGRLSAVESRYENGSIDKSISYGYDELDRLAKISYGASENETIKYDSWGRIIEKSKNGLVSRFKYDHFGRLVEKREGGSTSKYAYDNYGRRISRVTEKGGEVLDERNTYDKYGRLVKTESNGETVEYVYDKKNRLSGQKMGGVKVEYAYTEYGQVSRKSLIGADGKILSEIKYWYSPSGNITSRLANGKRQEYKYDAKNQLLAVIDAESKLPVESYEYDANGNILQKTIKGETTTYVYDASNQLVKGVMPDGKEVLYAYDAAGRLVQEGEKSYEYGWLDKVTRILENGKEVARFEYHNNNQLAKVIRENGIETFEWDGLALIERNGTKYINEPHTGGGIPILAIGDNTEAIFADMLGTSLGVTNGNNYSQITKTSFGADSNNANSFFTGKPHVEDLGYAFLLRNYRADIGKWLSQDLLGYPNGTNNFAYCGNSPSIIYDYLGAAWGWRDMIYCAYRDDSYPDYFDTDTMGITNECWNVVNSAVVPNLKSQIDAIVKTAVSGTSSNSGSQQYAIQYDTANSYNFSSVMWVMGDGVVRTYNSVSYTWNTSSDGKTINYSWESNSTLVYSDTFIDIFDTESLLGVNLDPYKMKPYDYGHTWYKIFTGTGSINKNEEEE